MSVLGTPVHSRGHLPGESFNLLTLALSRTDGIQPGVTSLGSVYFAPRCNVAAELPGSSPSGGSEVSERLDLMLLPDYGPRVNTCSSTMLC